MKMEINSADEYQRLTRRTMNPGVSERDALAMTALGLAGEAGELVEIIKKDLFHGHELDREKIAKEAGDTAWYLARLADTCGIPLSTIFGKNIYKLQIRYPDGFSEEASQNRADKNEG